MTTTLDKASLQPDPTPGPIGAIDHAILFANHVIVAGWCTSTRQPTVIALRSESGHELPVGGMKLARYPRPDVATLLGQTKDKRDKSGHGFIIAFPAGELAALTGIPATLEMSISDAASLIVSGKVALETVRIPLSAGGAKEHAVRTAAQTGVLEGAAALLVEARPEFDEHGGFRFALDAACRTASGIVADGWIENAREQDVVFVTDDCTAMAAEGNLFYKNRPDVTAHLKDIGAGVTTDSHGFIAHLPLTPSSTSTLLMFRLRQTPGGKDKLSFAGTLGIQNFCDKQQMLEMVWATVSGARFPTPDITRSLILPFVAETPEKVYFETHVIREGTVKPRVSIIVPFYKEAQFIRSIATMQMWFPEDYEWIIVCDDPGIATFLHTYLTSRGDLLRNRFVFVRNTKNYGYSTSNNIGAQVSQGDYLLFMNSDIWVDQVEPLEKGVEALQAKSHHLMGFRLLFEDGSIQHDGMDFVVYPDFHNMRIVEHPRKGLPASDASTNDIVDAKAVTGALMLIDKKFFREIGGFNRIYIRGDFEDADLCLRVQKLGGRVGLVRTGDIFHLERQSIRRMGNNSLRTAITYLNCITFNEQWGEKLAVG